MPIFAQLRYAYTMSLPVPTLLRLKTQLDCLPVLVAGAGEGALEKKPSTTKWSARENLAHLARYHEMFLDRLDRILREDQPLLERYSAEQDEQWPLWNALPASELLTRLRELRTELIDSVAQLSDEELSRTAAHSRFGTMTLVQWLEFFLLHEAHHLFVVMQRVRE
jgi:uncharacterized damage-inducible protein DinB